MERAVLAYPVKLWSIDNARGTGIRYRPKMSPQDHSIPLVKSQYHIIDPTNPGRALDDGVEHRLHVRGRPADDAEHFGSRRLMLQRLAQFCIALLQFLEQPHVLDGDHGLVGKGFEERDLLVSKRLDFRSANQDRPDRNALSKQRSRKYGSCALTPAGDA